jgi:hypothetical protein
MHCKSLHAHEILDDTVELGSFVTKAKLCSVLLYPGCESTEVLYGLRYSLRVYDANEYTSEEGNNK